MKRLALCFLLLACGKKDETKSSADTITAAASPVAAPPRTAGPDECPATGQWALCSVEKRLKRSGFVARKVEGESPDRAGFTVKPTVYTLGSGRLEVFLYENAAAMEKDIAALDTLTVSPPGTAPAWPSQAGLVRSGNLAAVYMGQSARQAERLTLAITAGAPSGS
ncbi:MAG TPA: hypothetical protein VFX40_03880 [Gemmatimonadaceae bacterium]|nr:hypothetical protein [Gemmatimonadaceae bacterium]